VGHNFAIGAWEMVEVRFENVCKSFGKVKAVNNLSLVVKHKEFLVLLGPSGCGKTTALRCVAGLERVDKGKIFIGDEDVTDLPPAKRGISMVFQSYAVFPHMKVFDNIAFGLKLRKIPADRVKEKVKSAATLLQIEDLLDRYPHQLSGGQRQRVAIARAIAVDPETLLMDEPLSNLDAKLRLQMREELKLLQRKLEATIIYVTHDQVEAMSMGDRVAVMKDGILEQVGTPREVYDNPENMFVGGFIGSPPMNMLEGSIVESDRNVAIETGDFTYQLPRGMEAVIKRAKTSEVVLGIRPEHITIVREHQKNAFRAKISVVELIGRELHVHLTSGEKLHVTVVTNPAQNLTMGGEVWLLPNEKEIHIFDKKTEEALI
jgi:multiple sugar transport system ATP-binding protein